MIVNDSTKALAQNIDDYFLVHPERHDQSHWVTVDGAQYAPVTSVNEENVCSTTMCIAGSAVFLSRPLEEFRRFDTTVNSWEEEGAELLGLEDNEADWLFFDTTEEQAIDAVRAIANGDVDKFRSMYEANLF